MKTVDFLFLATVVLLPSYLIRFPVFGVPMTVLEVLILLTFFVWLVTAKKRRFPLWWLAIMWVAVSVIGVAAADWSLAAWGIWKAYFLEPVLLYVVAVNVLDSREKINRCLTALSISAAVISLFAAYQYLTGDFIANELWASAAGRRATSFFPYPNAVGLYLAPVAVIMAAACLGLWSTQRRLAMWYGLAGGLSLVGILAARSDGALVGVVAALFLLGLAVGKKIRLVTAGVAVIAALTIVSVPSLKTYVGDRLALRDFSGQVRRLQWKETLIMLRDGRELTGAGLAAYQEAVRPYHQEGFFYNADNDPDFLRKVQSDESYRKTHWQPLEIYLYPHTIILNFWSEIGLVGMLVFFIIMIWFLVLGIKNFHALRKRDQTLACITLGLGLSFVAFAVHGLVDVPYFKNDLAAMFWLICGSIISINVIKKQE